MIVSKVAAIRLPKVRVPLTFARYSIAHKEHPERNDDTILLDRRRGLAAVFDGVGSGPGQVASRLAAQVIRRNWLRIQREPAFALNSEYDLEDELQQLLDEAHVQICQEGERRAAEASTITHTLYPATTAVMVLISKVLPSAEETDGEHKGYSTYNYQMSYVHVGDSRIYLWRPGEGLTRLTDDDGFLSLKIMDGSITAEDAQRIDQATSYHELTDEEQDYFDNRNAITQALGSHKPLDMHVGMLDLLPGDRILLCSDGIHDNLTDEEISVLLEKGARTTIAKKIVHQALACSNYEGLSSMRAKSDDMSAVVITYELSH